MVVLEGGAISYERGTPVNLHPTPLPQTPSPQALKNEWPLCSVGDRVRLVREADNKVNPNPDTQNWI